MNKLYLNHASNLDEIAIQLTAMHRVAMFEGDLMLDLMKSEEIRKRICYPDQYTLPPYRPNNQRGFYPRKYGMYHVLEKFKEDLEKLGVVFLTSSQITEMMIHENRVEGISTKSPSGNVNLKDIEQVYWTAGLPALALSLKLDLSSMKNDRREPASYVNLLFNKNPDMDLLYYFYCFDPGFRTFRVTNYTNYCPNASENRGYPVCVELWPEKGDTTDEKGVIARAVSELTSFGIINDSYEILFAKAEQVHGGGVSHANQIEYRQYEYHPGNDQKQEHSKPHTGRCIVREKYFFY